MIISERLRAIRESKQLTQADITRVSGLCQTLIEGVEESRMVPSLKVLDILASALSVPIHQLFFDAHQVLPLENLPGRVTADQIANGRVSEKRTNRKSTTPAIRSAKTKTKSF
ncbi:MAG: helix-turn-helix transcriptional regulator [Candidatus Acidiferrum sp.]|jgi:transcriptional regulator with XRE-family HTH domain